jgi:hypothetical protein
MRQNVIDASIEDHSPLFSQDVSTPRGMKQSNIPHESQEEMEARAESIADERAVQRCIESRASSIDEGEKLLGEEGVRPLRFLEKGTDLKRNQTKVGPNKTTFNRVMKLRAADRKALQRRLETSLILWKETSDKVAYQNAGEPILLLIGYALYSEMRRYLLDISNSPGFEGKFDVLLSDSVIRFLKKELPQVEPAEASKACRRAVNTVRRRFCRKRQEEWGNTEQPRIFEPRVSSATDINRTFSMDNLQESPEETCSDSTRSTDEMIALLFQGVSFRAQECWLLRNNDPRWSRRAIADHFQISKWTVGRDFEKADAAVRTNALRAASLLVALLFWIHTKIFPFFLANLHQNGPEMSNIIVEGAA